MVLTHETYDCRPRWASRHIHPHLGDSVPHSRSLLAFAFVLALEVQHPTSASGQAASTLGWASLGLGVGSIGAAGHAAGAVDYRGNAFTVRYATASELFGDDFWDAGLLYGRSLRGRQTYASLSAGAGVAGGTRSSGFLGTNTIPEPHRFTVPLEAQVGWRPTGFLGLALTLFGSLNNSGSFGGVTVDLQFGKLR